MRSMKKLLLTLSLIALITFTSGSLQQANEVLYVDFRADSMPRKLRDCVEGHFTESSTGLSIRQNTVLSIDLDKLSILHNFNGTSMSVLLQYASEYDIHPSLQLDKV